jgi:hypothetical protein
MNLLKRLIEWRPFQLVSSLGFGAVDTVEGLLYGALGLDRRPLFFRDWQTDRLAFDPPAVYPLVHPRGTPSPSFSVADARANYTAAVVPRRLSASEIAPWLPPGFGLDPAFADERGRYPVCYTFGYHQDLRRVWMIANGIAYLEVCIGVLGVRHLSAKPGFQGPFVFMPRLDLNRLYPTVLGRMVGLPKHWIRIETEAARYTVKGKYAASFDPYGQRAKPGDFPLLASWQELLSMPLVTQTSIGHLYMYFDWGWPYSWIQPIRGSLECLAPEIACMPPGRFDFAGIDEDPAGAFRIAMPWEMQAPFSRRSIPPPAP